MTAPTITGPQLALARNAAEAALAVLPTSRELVTGEPTAASAELLTAGRAITAPPSVRSSWWSGRTWRTRSRRARSASST
jgi:hypothetical protein